MFDRDILCVPIYKKPLIDSKDIIEQYKEKCDNLVEKHNEGWGYGWAGFCGSWNSTCLTRNILIESDLFSGLTQPILDCVQEYIDELGMYSEYMIELKQSWLNATGKYGFQEYHRHAPATISGCVYFSSPKEYGQFYVKNPFSYDLHDELNIFKGKKFIDLDAGDILLFPSNLEHGVAQNPKNKNRYSLCFNLYSSSERIK